MPIPRSRIVSFSAASPFWHTLKVGIFSHVSCQMGKTLVQRQLQHPPPPWRTSSPPGDIAAAVRATDIMHRFYNHCLTKIPTVTVADPSNTYTPYSEPYIHAGMPRPRLFTYTSMISQWPQLSSKTLTGSLSSMIKRHEMAR